MHKNLVLGILILLGMFSTSASAQQSNASIKSSVLITQTNHYLMGGVSSKPASKEIVLMKVDLTDEQKALLSHQPWLNEQHTELFSFARTTPRAAQPTKVMLDLNNLPVLDQGLHGSCVTFANSAAINSLLGKGDYISQLCSLMLGQYLEDRSYYPSGWDGSMASIVLNQFLQYGIVSKSKQSQEGCAGLTEYPLEDDSSIMSSTFKDIREYKKLSENLNKRLIWESVITFSERFSLDPSKIYQPDKVIKDVKYLLATKLDKIESRITFGVLLPYKHCNTGACASYKKSFDTWAISDEIKNDHFPDIGGHEMFLIGYDDNAIATDKAGKKHRGLFIMRNSWGNEVGDQGNFYMTYDFFKHYVDEIQNIRYFKHGN